MSKPIWTAVLCVLALAGATALAPGAGANSATITLSATIPNITTMSTTGCGTGEFATVQFGTAQPGTPNVTATDCTIGFGSTNETSALRVAQLDGYGAAFVAEDKAIPDPTWGTAGRLYDDVEPTRDDQPKGAFWDSSGRLIVVTNAKDAADDDIVISRFTSTGTLDGSFGTAGRVRIDLGENENINAVVPRADGTFWAVGDKGIWPNTDLMVMRFTSAGALDTTFDGDGWKTMHRSTWEWITQLHPLPDGTYLAKISDAENGRFNSRVIHLDSNMNIDPAYNDGTGVVSMPGWTTLNHDCTNMSLEPSGGFTCVGYREISGSNTEMLAIRRLPDGRADTSFDGDGEWTYNPTGGDDGIQTMQRLPNGKYMVAGGQDLTVSVVGVIARLNNNGSFDTSFDADGVWTGTFGGTPTRLVSAIPLANGNLQILGATGDGNGIHLAIGNLRQNLTWDTNYNGTGYRVLQVSLADLPSYVTGLQGADQRRAYLGIGAGGGDMQSVIVVTTNDTVPDYQNGVTDWDQGSGTFGMCLRAVGGGATAQWTANATCPATDGAYWNPVPTSPTKVAYNNTSGSTTGTAAFRFGLKPKLTQTPGQYGSMVTFSVIAPNV